MSVLRDRRKDDVLVLLQGLVGVLERPSVLRDRREDDLLVILQRLVGPPKRVLERRSVRVYLRSEVNKSL